MIIVSDTGFPGFVVKTTNNDWYTAGTVIGTTGPISLGQWHHIVGIYDGANLVAIKVSTVPFCWV